VRLQALWRPIKPMRVRQGSVSIGPSAVWRVHR
jgi:hypothetical protein